MRLIDKVITQGPEQFRKMPGSAVCLTIDEIAVYYANSPQQEWSADSYPYGKPPWKISFIEWYEPNRMLFQHGWEDNPVPGTQCGAYCVHFDGPPTTLIPALREMAESQGHIIHDLKIPEGAEEAASALMICPFISPRGVGAHYLGWNTFCFLNYDGFELRTTHIGYGIDRLGNHEQQQLATARIVHHILLAFTFINCSNVKLVDSTDQLEPLPKIKRRLRIPSIKRYTLEISGHRASARRTFDGSSDPVMPFHLCRGHFATYTDEAKLFGKYVGRFWIPPHTKGKRELGEIVKDYSIT